LPDASHGAGIKLPAPFQSKPHETMEKILTIEDSRRSSAPRFREDEEWEEAQREAAWLQAEDDARYEDD